MTMPIQPVQSGPSEKEHAMIGLNHALLNAFHNLYLGKKKPMPAGLETQMQLHQSPGGQQDISQQQPPVGTPPPTPLGLPKQGIPLTAIAARLMGRRV